MAPRYHPDLPAPHSASLRVCFVCFYQTRVYGQYGLRQIVQGHPQLSFFLFTHLNRPKWDASKSTVSHTSQ